MFTANRSASAWVIDADVTRGGVQRIVDPDHAILALVVDVRRMQRRARLDRQPRRTGGKPGRFTEEVDLDAGPGQVTVGHQADEPVVP